MQIINETDYHNHSINDLYIIKSHNKYIVGSRILYMRIRDRKVNYFTAAKLEDCQFPLADSVLTLADFLLPKMYKNKESYDVYKFDTAEELNEYAKRFKLMDKLCR